MRVSFDRDHGEYLRHHLTGRECHYAGTKCQYRDENGNRPCWQPATHRVTNGPYAWWFVCARHVPAVATSKGWSLRVVATTPGQVAAARLIVELGRLWYRARGRIKRCRWRQRLRMATLQVELHGIHDDPNSYDDRPPPNPWWATCRVPLASGGACVIDSGRRATAWEAIDVVTDNAVTLAERTGDDL